MFKILLVDDEPIIKIGVRKLLEGTDYIIAGTASNGSEALLFLETNSVDIILTDLKMPVEARVETLFLNLSRSRHQRSCRNVFFER